MLEFFQAETKVKKAGDEYRQFVEKYSKVRNEFEEGMTQSSRVIKGLL